MNHQKTTKKEPCALELKAGDHYWCACGCSKNQPFCDGTHNTLPENITPVKFTLEAEKKVWLCQCKQTKTPPYCDGTHNTI
jgi:CDGSH-type Zn-finger protein